MSGKGLNSKQPNVSAHLIYTTYISIGGVGGVRTPNNNGQKDLGHGVCKS